MCCSLVCFGCMWFGWCVAGCSFVLVACGYVGFTFTRCAVCGFRLVFVAGTLRLWLGLCIVVVCLVGCFCLDDCWCCCC